MAVLELPESEIAPAAEALPGEDPAASPEPVEDGVLTLQLAPVAPGAPLSLGPAPVVPNPDADLTFEDAVRMLEEDDFTGGGAQSDG